MKLLIALLLFVSGALSSSFGLNGRRMLMIERKANIDLAAGAQEENVATEISTYDDDQPGLNNHHKIPRQSWDGGQNPYAPATVRVNNAQENGEVRSRTSDDGHV